MLKFKNKDLHISQLFGANPNAIFYGSGGHTGIDYILGYGRAVPSHCDGFVYKIWEAKERTDNWQGVYTLVHATGNLYAEVGYGHLSKIMVDVGEEVPEGAIIGEEGNLGQVFSNGVVITPEMQKNGDKRGSHVHFWIRPVVKVEEPIGGLHYLRDKKGNPYFKDGYYQTIFSNVTDGCIDPLAYVHTNSLAEDTKMLAKVVIYYTSKFTFS